MCVCIYLLIIIRWKRAKHHILVKVVCGYAYTKRRTRIYDQIHLLYSQKLKAHHSISG